jgi:selenocysteine lyase/cysteine desulfurase
MATAAKNINLKKGQSVIILEKQFPSNVYPWQDLAKKSELNLITIKKENGFSLTESILQAIQSDTGLLALPNCHWMDGAYVDLEKVSRKAKSVGALLVLDLSQSLGALPTNIDQIDPDFAVAAGYKWMLGPYGLGYMYIAPRWQNVWEPLENSWLTREKSEDFSQLTEYTSILKSGAKKFDAGEYLMLSLRTMSIAGAKQILSWGVENIQSSIGELTAVIKDYNESKGISVQESVGHISAIPFGDRDPRKIKEALAKRNINVSYRDTYIRVSPHLYNTREEIDSLLKCVDQV